MGPMELIHASARGSEGVKAANVQSNRRYTGRVKLIKENENYGFVIREVGHVKFWILPLDGPLNWTMFISWAIKHYRYSLTQGRHVKFIHFRTRTKTCFFTFRTRRTSTSCAKTTESSFPFATMTVRASEMRSTWRFWNGKNCPTGDFERIAYARPNRAFPIDAVSSQERSHCTE